MIEYGKPSGPLLAHKQGFFAENRARLAEMARLAGIYAAQPRRGRCKNCEGPLGGPDFVKLGVGYALCPACGHLNGCHEDTPEFCAAVYTDDGGAAYGATYAEADRAAYFRRVEDIYEPKARFLARALEERGESLAATAVADFGAGSGYFVAALRRAGAGRAVGFEVSERQAALGRAMLGDAAAMVVHGLDDTARLAAETDAGLVSMIGVLEHMRSPRQVLAALAANPGVRHVYFSVPLFSACVFLEMAFPGVFPRQLAGGHTHLYTESSIDHFCREFGFRRAAEWWFGTDMVDVYRNLLVSLADNPETAGAAPLWERSLKPALDDMQLAMDRRRLSSEVHMLLAKEGA